MKSKLTKKPLIVVAVILIIAVAASSMTGCSVSTAPVTDEMFAIDTIIKFTVYADTDAANKAIDTAKAEITRLESMLSASIETSDISSINNSKTEPVNVSEETADLINRSLEISKTVNGAFDISVRPLVTLWGFDTKNFTVPSDNDIKSTIGYVDYKKISVSDTSVRLSDNMSLDLGAIAKGYIADRVVSVMCDSGITSAIVSLGGNVVAIGKKPSSDFSIGIEYPDGYGDSFAVINGFCGAAVTSGAYQRYFEQNSVRYHHIIDPETGYPSDSDISSVTVFSDDSTLCDALSTAFFVMGIEKTTAYCKANPDIDVAILSADYKTLYVTSNIKSRLSLTKGYNDISIKEIK